MSLFDRFRRGRRQPATGGASGKTLAELKDFIATREGVEAYVEPPTAVYALTICLVAADGEHVRRPVKDERQARHLCDDHGVPLYDARKVGYPSRMREYERGVRSQRVGLEDLPPLDLTDEPEQRGEPRED